jgi:hypothetical protein
MTLFKDATWSWVLDPPQNTLAPDALATLTSLKRWAVLISAMGSYALAETFLAQPLQNSPHFAPGMTLLLNFLLPFTAFFLVLALTFEIRRIIQTSTLPFHTWFSAGVIAVIPLHLLLPLALLCRPLGMGGLLIYTLGECLIATAVIRRGAWGVETLCEWPLWAAYLLILSPLLMACGVVMLCSAVLMAAIALVLLGTLA